MPTYRTPDVYVEEISVFPPSVAEVETAIPAFIGYTEKAAKAADGDLAGKPTKIFSLKEFESYYGLPEDHPVTATVDVQKDGDKIVSVTVTKVEPPKLADMYILYYSVKAFFDNGGGKCYIVSAGTYKAAAPFLKASELESGLDAVAMEDEPTLLVIPEAVQLTYAEYKSLTQRMLTQCGTLGDRFAILDVFGGDRKLDEEVVTVPGSAGPPAVAEKKAKLADASREAWSTNLKYGAAYYPFLRTTLNYYVNPGETNVKVKGSGPDADLVALKTGNTAVYNAVTAALKDQFVVLPPSGPVAGVYAATDTARGVWKAPANAALADVIEPVSKLSNALQDDLNVDPTSGKSINALRSFSGKGTLVWGARTLAGNDNEWRYISVRRFFNMVEESVKKSTYWAVFEPNDANTWVKVRGMIENYLTQKWREGALAGATTKDAFFVRCGLGTTMSAQDILEGRMIVEIGMAVVRPAEFIILRFSHKLQTS